MYWFVLITYYLFFILFIYYIVSNKDRKLLKISMVYVCIIHLNQVVFCVNDKIFKILLGDESTQIDKTSYKLLFVETGWYSLRQRMNYENTDTKMDFLKFIKHPGVLWNLSFQTIDNKEYNFQYFSNFSTKSYNGVLVGSLYPIVYHVYAPNMIFMEGEFLDIFVKQSGYNTNSLNPLFKNISITSILRYLSITEDKICFIRHNNIIYLEKGY